MLDDPAPNPLASNLERKRFMLRYWQRRPAVVRSAIAVKPPLIDRAGLFELASRDDVEARLIQRRGRRWQLDHGPFARDQLPQARARRWTLLVQSVDHHLEPAAAMLQRFRFVPDVRLDDLMISIAGDEGGVGPHQDSYDVFLVQLAGQRRWTLGRPGDYALRSDQPLRLITDFEPIARVDLMAGDMLYLPPGWVHDGVAVGECITASVGFRSPHPAELLAAWLVDCAERTKADDPAPRFAETVDSRVLAAWQRHPARLPTTMTHMLQGWLQAWQPEPREMQRFIGRYLTEPKATVWFDRPDALACRSFTRKARRNGVTLDRRTRISYRQTEIFINGDSVSISRPMVSPLHRLADRRHFEAAECRAFWPLLGELLHEWHAAGWLHAR